MTVTVSTSLDGSTPAAASPDLTTAIQAARVAAAQAQSSLVQATAQAELAQNFASDALSAYDQGVAAIALALARIAAAGGISGMLLPQIVHDTSYVATLADGGVRFPTLTATRSVTLPDASAFPLSTSFPIIDESGNCSPSAEIIVIPSSGQKIGGVVGATVAIGSPYAVLRLFKTSDGTGWIY